MDERQNRRDGSFARELLGVTLAVVVGLTTVVGVLAPAASAKRRTYCTRHHHPHGCVKVPPAARRPQGVNQQGSSVLTPSDVENGGGLGGGPGNHRDIALQWARSQTGDARWRWRCERFVEEAFGTRGRFPTARAAAKGLHLHRGSIASAPAGSLVYFAADRYNQGWGHVGVALGGGKMLSALSQVTTTDVAKSRYWRGLYLGWADAPADWPGRIPPPPGPTTEDPTVSVRITAPALGSPQSGVVPLLAGASGAGGIEFQAYYATDPRSPLSRDWHVLGTATSRGDSWGLDWDTTTVPDQGAVAWGTVNIAAIALDAAGHRTGTRDYRRISIANAVLPGTPPVTPVVVVPPEQQAPRTYAETTGGAANTWSDPQTAGGTRGPGIASNQTVQISCRRTGFAVQDGNTWWYRIAQSPWNDQFYVSADAFYNNGSTSGSLIGTPFYDPAVPQCP
jgi:hypothetical protein